MNEIQLENLPEGAEVVGHLYDDPDMIYDSGDVMYVKLPNGAYVDLGWNDEDGFVITVWTGHFGNDLIEVTTEDRHEAASLVAAYSRKYAEYTTYDLIAAAIENGAYRRYLEESAEEVDRLYGHTLKYAFLSSMGGLAIMLSMFVGSVFGEYVVLVVAIPCFVACHLYAVLMERKCDETFARMLKRAEKSA